MMRFFLGADPVSVFGRSWNPPWSWYDGDASATALIQFAGGISATYTGSWCATGRETPWNAHWRFDCANGVVALIDDQVWVYPRMADQAPHQVEPVTMPRAAQAYLLHEFYEAVTTGGTPATICQDNIRSLEIVFGVVESFKSGGVVAL
jgi:predicted dehydrogenase